MGEARYSTSKRVYYVSGFDPRGAAYYHRLFSEQLSRFMARTGRALMLGSRRRDGQGLMSRWLVEEAASSGGIADGLDYCFLHWDDIVRRFWMRNPFQLIHAGLLMSRYYIFQGALWRIARMSYPAALCGLAPVVVTLTTLVVATAAAVVVASLAAAQALPAPLVWLAALAMAAAVWVVAWQLAERVGMVWMFRSMQFTRWLGHSGGDALSHRLRLQARAILGLEQQEPAAEILVVGHSIGSFVMAMLAAELRRQPEFAAIAPRLSLLTLGQSLPFLAEQESATAFHADLKELSLEPRLPWRDISSTDDFLCFPGVNPFASGGLPVPEPAYPVMELIPLAQRHGLTSLRQVIQRQMGLHFEYLATAEPDRSGGFDYLDLVLRPVANPLPAGQPLP